MKEISLAAKFGDRIRQRRGARRVQQVQFGLEGGLDSMSPTVRRGDGVKSRVSTEQESQGGGGLSRHSGPKSHEW